MKLFYSKGACSLAVRIIITELNLDCNFEAVDLKTKKTNTGKNFLDFNSKGAVPLLEISPEVYLSEVAVILQYLADSNQAYNLLPALKDLKRYRTLEWLNYVATEMHKGFSPLFNPKLSQEFKDSIFIPILKSKFEYLNAKLDSQSYLLGSEFTLPDAYLFVILSWANKLNINFSNCLSLTKYFSNLQQRSSIKHSLEAEGLL